LLVVAACRGGGPTGVVAIATVQDGYLALDDPAADTLTEWRSDLRKSRITVRELLACTLGSHDVDLRPPR